MEATKSDNTEARKAAEQSFYIAVRAATEAMRSEVRAAANAYHAALKAIDDKGD